MGKQKSFIIVGSTFLAIILILSLIPVFTKGLKDSKIKFDTEKYYVELGKDRGLSPIIYASDKISKNFELEYNVDKEGIIQLLPGTYAKGAYDIHLWAFNEADEDGNTVYNETEVPYNAEDKISIIDGEWAINGVKTKIKAQKNYSDSELEKHAGPSEAPTSVECFILNGIQTNFPCKEGLVPVRDMASGNWFIEGKDTGITFKGVQTTIKSLAIGEVTLTVSGMIKKQKVSATVKIEVCEPDPKTLEHNYINDTVVVKTNTDLDLQWKVNTYEGAFCDPLQKLNLTATSEDKALNIKDNKTINASKAGKYKLKLKVPDESFRIDKVTSIFKYINVVALDIPQAQIDLINNFRSKVNEIKFSETVEKTDMALLNTTVTEARTLLSQIDQSNPFVTYALTNLENYYIGEAILAIENIADVDGSESSNKTILAAREIVENISENHRNKVINIAKYNVSEAELAIILIGNVENNEECIKKVTAARELVDKLNRKEIKLVKNISDLKAAESILIQLHVIDKANGIIDIVEEIRDFGPFQNTPEFIARIIACREKINKLDEESKKTIINLDILEALEIEASKSLINSFGEAVNTPEYIAKVLKAKSLIENISSDKLEDFEEKKDLNNALVKVAIFTIDNVDSTLNAKDFVLAIANAREIVEIVPKGLQSAITNKNKLVEFDLTATIKAIDSIGTIEDTKEFRENIKFAQELFEKLTEANKKKVTNLRTLALAETNLINFDIANIKNTEFSSELDNIVREIRARYNKIGTKYNDYDTSADKNTIDNDEDKKLVTNYEELLLAEDILK